MLGFAAAFVGYFSIMVDFGTQTVGSREIAKDRSNMESVVGSVISYRSMTCGLGFTVYCVVVALLKEPILVKVVLFISGLSVFTIPFNLDFVFIGVEKMGFVATRVFGSSVLTLIGVFLLVHNLADVWIAAGIPVFSNFLNTAWLFRYYLKRIGRVRILIDFKALKHLLLQSWPVGLSALMISVYYNMDTVMLGFMRSKEEVGLYTAAYKIIYLVALFQSAVNQSIFPTLSRLWESNREKLRLMVETSMDMMLLVSAVVTIGVFDLSGLVIRLAFGSHFGLSSNVLRVLIFTMSFVYNETVTAPLLYATGRQKRHLIAVSLGALTNTLLNFLLIPQYGMFGAAAATIAAEVVVFTMLYIYARRIVASSGFWALRAAVLYSLVLCVTVVLPSLLISTILLVGIITIGLFAFRKFMNQFTAIRTVVS